MIQRLNQLFILALLLTGITACQQSQNTAQTPEKASEPTPEPVELIISLVSDVTTDAHSSLMGLHLGQNALKNGIPVTVFLSVDGVKLMSAGAEAISFRDENLHELLKTMISNGAQVIACPHCMEAQGLQASNLMEGVKMSNEDMMMGKIKSSPTVFTY